MKLTTKLLIITLLALSFFMTEPKNILQTDTSFTIASEEATDYEIEYTNKVTNPRSLNSIILK